MCLNIWYMPLKPAIDIHNIYLPTATNWVDTTYLHLHTYFHNPPKKAGLNCGSMTCPTGGAPNINYGKNNYGKNNYGKTGQSALAP